ALGGYGLDSQSRASMEQYAEQFNRRVEERGRPELRIGAAVVSASRQRHAAPVRTPAPARSTAAAIDPRLEKLRAVFQEIRTTIFPRLPDCKIVIDAPDDKRLGTFSDSKREIWINPAIFDGTHRAVRGGSGDPLGLLRFAGDVLLHECVHCHLRDLLGRGDPH